MRTRDPNSMFIWLPKVEEAGIPQPRTQLFEVERQALMGLIDEPDPTMPPLEEVIQAITEAATSFGFPMFLRTDLASGKHTWRRSCFVPTAEDFVSNLAGVIEANELAGFFGLEYTGLAFRELLTLDSRFTAFDEMPVAAERRYFAGDGVVHCHHAYWFEKAIETSWKPKPENWRSLLAELNDEANDPPELAEWAARVTTLLPSRDWSVDFARKAAGDWVLIDMALAEASWHPEHGQ